MLLFLAGFHQGINYIAEHMQRFVYVAALLEPVPLDFRLLGSLAAR